MRSVFDFLMTVLPWAAIGIMAAVMLAEFRAKKSDRVVGNVWSTLSRISFGCFLLVAVMEFLQGKISSGTTWLVLAVCNTVVKSTAGGDD